MRPGYCTCSVLAYEAVEALQEAQNIAVTNSNNQVEAIHLLSALIESDDGFATKIIETSTGEVRTLREKKYSSHHKPILASIF